MKTTRFLLVIAFVGISTFVFLVTCCRKVDFDIIIDGGRILDGTGNPWYYADIGIKDGRIVKIGDLDGKRARSVIDARGLYVCPGFVDVHTHVDRKIAEYPVVPNYLLQGVTTVVGGNCGGHPFPLRKLFKKLEEKGIGINFACLIGHNTIRREVMGNDDRQPTDEELEEMKKLVRQEMKSGALGFSTGLAYVPGRFSKTEEIIELVKEIAPYGGVYATHMRNQGEKIKEAIEEAIRIGREAGVPVEISHIKLATEAVWGKYELIYEPVEKARAEGMQVFMDQYPYTATSSGFTSSFPAWAVAGGHEAFVKRLEDLNLYEKIKSSLIEKRLKSIRGIDRLKTIYVAYDRNHPEYNGKNLSEILGMMGKKKTISNAADLIIKLEKEDRPRGIFFQMTEEDVIELMKKPYTMIASDGKVEVPGVGVPHPRSYGTFPRIIARYVREKGVLALEDAVRKMTSLPAIQFGFYDRGLIREGMVADIVVFDYKKIKDVATYEDPHQYPIGINCVIVNGIIAARNGKVVYGKAGKVLYGKGIRKMGV